MTVGVDIDDAVDQFDGGLIVNRVRGHGHGGGRFFGIGRSLFRRVHMIQTDDLGRNRAFKSQKLDAARGRLYPLEWTYLSPMWAVDANPDFLATGAKGKTRCLRKTIPRWERSGLVSDSLRSVSLSQHRSSLWMLFVVVLSRELLSRLMGRFRKAK